MFRSRLRGTIHITEQTNCSVKKQRGAFVNSELVEAPVYAYQAASSFRLLIVTLKHVQVGQRLPPFNDRAGSLADGA